MADAEPAVETVTGGQLVVRTLRELGVRYVFGIPGGQTLAITDAILDDPGIEFVTTRHEGAAACMADAVGRLTGTPGVCLATTGPGATNLITGVGGAFRDSSPVLVLTCNNRIADLGRDDAQAADHVALFDSLTKWATLVTEPRTVPRVLHEAAIRATSGCPGPVLVDFARTTVEGRIAAGAADDEHAFPVRVAGQRPLGDPAQVERAADLLAAAHRPVLWLGNGVQLSGASSAVLDFAREFDLPVITTFNALGAVETDHPNVFGPLSRMGTSLGHEVIAGSDLVLAVGNSLNAISTARWNLRLPEQLVQIDTDGELLGRNYPNRTTGIVGDARAVIGQIGDALRGAHVPSAATASRKERLESLRHAKAAWWQRSEDIDRAAAPMTPMALMRVLREQAADDTVLVVDAGNPGVWSHLWQVRRANSYLKPVGFGNMGFGLPAAIAAKLVEPRRPVIALVGDGSLGMSLGELETVQRQGVVLSIVVMNDQSYGNIRQEQLVHFGDRTIGVDFAEVDFAAVARGFGIAAAHASSADDLAGALSKALGSGEPALIDARIDRSVNAWTFPLFGQSEPEE